MLNKRTSVQIIIILIAVVFAILSWTVLAPEPKPLPLPTIPVTDNPPENADELFVPEKITATYEIAESGAHRLSGKINLPKLDTGCYDLKFLSPVISEDQKDVQLRFRTKEESGENCDDQASGTWIIAVNATKDAQFRANFNWQEVPLILEGRQ